MFHVAALAMPIQSTLSPAMGRTCGRREREADPGIRPAVATVEGTLIRGMPSAFAGGRNNAGLGRSESRAAGLVPLQAVAPATTGALRKNEEGNVVSVWRKHYARTHREDAE